MAKKNIYIFVYFKYFTFFLYRFGVKLQIGTKMLYRND